jgi:hypothetical protein
VESHAALSSHYRHSLAQRCRKRSSIPRRSWTEKRPVAGRAQKGGIRQFAEPGGYCGWETIGAEPRHSRAAGNSSLPSLHWCKPPLSVGRVSPLARETTGFRILTTPILHFALRLPGPGPVPNGAGPGRLGEGRPGQAWRGSSRHPPPSGLRNVDRPEQDGQWGTGRLRSLSLGWPHRAYGSPPVDPLNSALGPSAWGSTRRAIESARRPAATVASEKVPIHL